MTEDRRPHSRACGWRQHSHGPDCHPNCPTCHGQPIDSPDMLKYGVVRIVSESERKENEHREDVLAWTEKGALMTLVGKVYDDGRTGVGYPVIVRTPMSWTNGELVVDRLTPEEWHIRISVWTVPK